METQSFIGWQFGMTFLAVLVVAAVMLWRVRRSQQRSRRLAAERPGEHRPTVPGETTRPLER
jgi:hypothetical protein